MASYYYLVASLPSLRYEGSLPFTSESFLKLCTNQLSDAHLEMIRAVLAGEPCSHRFVRSYQHFASMVKKELTEQRSRKLSLSDPSYKNDGDKEAHIADVVRQALSMEDVLIRAHERMGLRLHRKKQRRLLLMQSNRRTLCFAKHARKLPHWWRMLRERSILVTRVRDRAFSRPVGMCNFL